MIEFISGIFGSIIRMIYLLVGNNYALSIILFTILTKVVLFPLMYKQQKSMKEMQKVAPLEQEIRNKYKSSPEKMQTELMTLYSQHKVNPMGGCLPLLIQMPIIFAMFYIVKQPLTYIKQMPYEQIKPYAVEAYKDQLKAQGKNQADIDKLAAKMDKKTAKMLEIEAAKKGNLIDMNFFGVNLGDIPSKAPTKKPYLLLIPLLTLLTAM
ncbi:MAG: YidC/Oxa1 family membrane protein insertase, partial [Clostridia bacterium]